MPIPSRIPPSQQNIDEYNAAVDSTVQSIMGDLERFVQGGVETGTNLGYDPFQFPDDDRRDILGAFTTPNHPYLKPQVGAYFNSLLEQNADDLNPDILNDVLNNLVFQAENSGGDINNMYEANLHLAYRNLAETAYNIFPDEIVNNNRNVIDYVNRYGDHPEFPALGILDNNRAGRREFEQWLHHDYNLYEDMNEDYMNELSPMYGVSFIDRLTQASMGIVDDFLTSIYDIDKASLPWNKDSEYTYNIEPYMGAEGDASKLFMSAQYDIDEKMLEDKALELGISPNILLGTRLEGSDFTYEDLFAHQSPVLAAEKLAETHGTGEGTLFDYNYKDRNFRNTMLGDLLDLEPVERNQGPYADAIVESARSLIGTDISRPGAKSEFPGGVRYGWTCADYACDAATKASIPWPVDENGKHSSYIPYIVNAFRGIGIPGKNNPNLSKQFDEINKINEIAPGDFAFISGLSHSVVITQVYKDGTIEIAHTGGEDRPVFSKTYSKEEWEGLFARDMGVAFRFNGKSVK